MKKTYRIYAMIMTMVLLFGVFPFTEMCIWASVENEIPEDSIGVPVTENTVQEQVEVLLDWYFSARSTLDTTECSELLSDFALPTMVEDEINRLNTIEDYGVLTINNTYSINELTSSEYIVCVSATETVGYNTDVSISTSDIEHDLMFVYDSETNIIKLVRDCYYEEFISYESLSYIEQRETSSVYANSTATNDHENTGDYAYDLIQVALTQEGYHEKATNDDLESKTGNSGFGNWTKYGAWYDGGAYNGGFWCAMFVSWCADQANIPPSIIEPNCRANEIRQKFINIGLFQYPIVNGNIYSPKIGDLICFDHHIGIVISSDSEYVYIIDGNFHTNNDVRQREYTLTDTSIIGYATPAYENGTTHSWGLYEHDGSQHWRFCALCGVQSEKSNHFWVLNDIDTKKCKYCRLIQWNHVLQNILVQLKEELY